MDFVSLLIYTAIVFISAIPLHIAVRLLGGKTSFLKTAIVHIIAGIVVWFVQSLFSFWGGFIAFFLVIFLYREAFRLRWWKAIVVWLLAGLIMALFVFIMWLLRVSVFT